MKRKLRLLVLTLVTCHLSPLLVGCKTPRLTDIVIGPSYRPENVHCAPDHLASEVRRVAVLPVTYDATRTGLEAGRDLFEPLLSDELIKKNRFELVSVSPEELRRWTGRRSWTAEERLPVDFFKVLQDELGCEAVLFCHLTRFHAYPPLAVGMNLKLVDAHSPMPLWAADEVLDAADPSVVNGARRYQQTREQLPAALADSRSILNSPRGFSRYAAATVLSTLPER